MWYFKPSTMFPHYSGQVVFQQLPATSVPLMFGPEQTAISKISNSVNSVKGKGFHVLPRRAFLPPTGVVKGSALLNLTEELRVDGDGGGGCMYSQVSNFWT